METATKGRGAKRFLAGFAAFLYLSASLWSQNAPLTVITEDWAPYNYKERGVLRGFSVEIARHILADLKIKPAIQLLPSMRTTAMMKSGKRTIFFSMFRTPEREHLYKLIGPVADGAIHFYKRKGDPSEILTMEDVKKAKSVACRNGGLVFDALTAAGNSRSVPPCIIFGG